MSFGFGMLLKVRVKPGESALAFYTAENKSSAPITGVSTYNVTPMKVCISLGEWLSNFSYDIFSLILQLLLVFPGGSLFQQDTMFLL